jgi:catechol 2,3-dioxygenase-like lactoylglutathione lyase family enzyme
MQKPLQVGSVHHVSFRVDNLETALAFYEGVLGCRRLPRPDGLPGARGAWLKSGSTEVHLTEAPADEATGYPPSRIVPFACHVAFHVDDLDALEAGLSARGVERLRGDFGLAQIFVRDPSGNLLEFTPY